MKRISAFHTTVNLIILSATAFLVSSCGNGGSGSWSSTTTPSANPTTILSSTSGAPMAVSAVAGNGTVMLGWSSVASAVYYNVYRSTSSGTVGTKIASPNTNTYLDSNLTNNTTYYYIVTSIDNTGKESGASNQVSAKPVATIGPITISGQVQYQDKEYGSNGFTGNLLAKAVRFATVELVDAVTTSVLYSTTTDSTGLYSFSTSTGAAAVYVRVNAEASPPGSSSPIQVEDLSANIYAVVSDNFIPSGNASVNITVTTTSIGGAFNILDVLTNGFQFDYTMSSGMYPPALTAYWQPNSCNPLNGTYYCDGNGCGNEGIYVLNDPTGSAGCGPDTDEYDDDVLYHEFGHFTAAHFSKDDSPGGTHFLTSNDLDMRLAWSEGWGDSMPGNIKLWLSTSGQANLLSSSGVPLTEYVDTIPGGAGVAIDMDNPDWTSGYAPVNFSYATNEVAVAKILLDMNGNVGMPSVWSVIADFQAHPPATPVNIELFWDRWNSLESPSTLSSLQTAFNNRLIIYSDLSTNNTFSTAVPVSPGSSVTYNLYPAGDADYFSFNAFSGQHYTITTSQLLNGADTIITLFNPDLTLTLGTTPPNPNDNANGTIYSGTTAYPSAPSDVYSSLVCDSYGVCHENANSSFTSLGFDILGSQLAFTAASSGTYYVKVQSSSSRPVSSGRYGTFTLKITSP